MATKVSRSTHTVRVTSMDKRFYADVEVLDAISLTLPNGFQICYKISQPKIVEPLIIDNTGDGNGKAGSTQSTRASHMVRMTSTTNTTMFFDVEVCDAFTITGPNNTQFCIKCPTPGKSVAAITDKTDANIGVGATSKSTRAQHVVKLLHQVGSGEAGRPNQQVTTDFTYIVLTDAMSYSGPSQSLGMPFLVPVDFGGPADVSSFPNDYNVPTWWDFHALKFYNNDTVQNGALEVSVTTNDTTQYVVDPGTGTMIPPPNTDANVYVYFPEPPKAMKSTSGPFLGKPPYMAAGVPTAGGGTAAASSVSAIDMGPIWWIRALGSTDNVWFWFLSPIQQPYAVSFFGSPPEGANPKWAYRGFTLLPTFPVAWLLSENYPMIPMGTYGANNLEMAAEGYIPNGGEGAGEITVNWFGVGYPDGGWGVSTAVGDVGALIEAGTAGYLAPITYLGYQYYMPFGAFDLIGPTSQERLAATRALLGPGSTASYTNYGGPAPNIWQLTGIQQPPLVKPGELWDPNSNPHQQPSLALAMEVAQTFKQKWNNVATQITAAAHACTSTGGVPGFPETPPPGWDWALPYGGDTVPTAQMFSNGWVPAVLAAETVPITVPTIDVGQLDPSIWNVEPVLTNGTPPVMWATGVP